MDDYVDCGDDDSLDLVDHLTLVAWVRHAPGNVGYVIIRNDAGDGIRLFVKRAPKLGFKSVCELIQTKDGRMRHLAFPAVFQAACSKKIEAIPLLTERVADEIATPNADISLIGAIFSSLITLYRHGVQEGLIDLKSKEDQKRLATAKLVGRAMLVLTEEGFMGGTKATDVSWNRRRAAELARERVATVPA